MEIVEGVHVNHFVRLHRFTTEQCYAVPISQSYK